MKTPTRQRAATASLALSLAVHLGLVLWLSRTPPPAPPPKPKPTEFEIVERPRPPPPKPPEPKPEPPRPEPRPEPKPRPRPKVAQAPTPPPPVQPPPVQPPPPVEPRPEVPRAEPPPKPALPNFADAARQQATGTIHGGDVSTGDVPVAGAPDGGIGNYVHAPEVIGDPNDRVATMLGGEQGKRRVERGLVDPYFGQVSKALSKGWNPEPKITQRSLDGFIKQGKQNMQAGTQIYQKLAEAYGKGGSPLGATDEPHGAQTHEEAVRDYRRKMVETWKQSKRTLVRITQGPGGMLQHVELVQSSADPSMDAEIIRSLQQGEVVLPVPPQSGQGIRSPIRSVWSFELVISISPPVPTLTGSFDEVTGKLDVRMPLDRRIFKHVELVSVD